MCLYLCFFFNYTATTESYTYVRTLALNDALPIYQHLVGIDFRRGDDLELHRVFRRTVALAANHPAIHVLRHMADRRNLADLVKILVAALGGGAARGLQRHYRPTRIRHGETPLLLP